MKHLISTLLASMTAALFLVQPAVAAPVTMAFEGVIESVYHATSTDPFGTAISIGTPLSGRYTFDTATPNTGNSGYGVYIDSSSSVGLQVQVGSFSGSSATALVPLNYRIITDGLNNNNVVQDIQTQDFLFGGVNAYLAQIFLEGLSTSLSSVDLSSTAPNLADYFTHTFVLGIGPLTHAADVVYQGTITSIHAVPEPPIGSLLALTVVVAGLASMRRRSGCELLPVSDLQT